MKSGPPEGSPADRGRRHHLLFALLSGAACLLAVASFANAWVQREWLGEKWLVRRPTALATLGVFALISVSALSALLLTWRGGRWRSTSFTPLRCIIPILVAAWASLWTLEPPTIAQDGEWALAAAAAAWIVSVALRAPRPDRGGRAWTRVLDVAVCEIAVLALLSEAGLRLVRRATNLPILATPSTSPEAWLRAWRLDPGELHCAFPANREGYVDVDPEEARARPLLVACVGDSFSVGIVPHRAHYTTVAERCFDGLEVYNVGVVNSGPREYVRMIEASARPLHPDLVVVALFLGNDLTDAERGDPTTLSTWMDRDEILLLQVPRRLQALYRERHAASAPSSESVVQPGTEEARFPWLADPAEELPTLSSEIYDEVESTRAKLLLHARPASWEKMFLFLERVREASRPIPLACLLIPDVFQVEDALWEELRAKGAVRAARREQPQEILADWLERARVPCIDLLPRLRAVPPLADGQRHLYHLRDTHFNARGNRLAAEALAELIERCGVASRLRTAGDAPR